MRFFGYPYNDLVICKDSPDYLGRTNDFLKLLRSLQGRQTGGGGVGGVSTPPEFLMGGLNTCQPPLILPVSPCTIHLPTSKHIFYNAKDANTLYKDSHLKNH